MKQPGAGSSASHRDTALFLLFWLAVVVVIVNRATRDDEIGRRALDGLTPVISILAHLGDWWVRDALFKFTMAGASASCCLAILSGLALFRLRDTPLSAWLMSAGVAIQAQLVMLHGFLFAAGSLYLVAISCVIVGWFWAGPDHYMRRPLRWEGAMTISEWCFLMLLTLIGCGCRLYALNHLFNFFEGEVMNWAAASTSLKGVFLANRGLGGSWAPLGFLYYLQTAIAVLLFGTTVLALRMSAAIISVGTIPLIYLLARRIGGPLCAAVASGLYVLDPLHFGWSRSDVYPHDSTTWPTVVMCWLTLLALQTRTRWSCLLLAFMMGLSWHQYPSGQVGFLIPLGAVFLYTLVFSRSSGFRSRRFLFVCVSAGAILWFFGLPLSYYPADRTWFWPNPLTLTTARTSWGLTTTDMTALKAATFVLTEVARNTRDLAAGMFVNVPYLDNQSFLPLVDGVGVRTVPWIVIALAVPAVSFLCLRAEEPGALVLLIWLLAGSLPSVLSSGGYPKRAATIYPAISCIVAIFISMVGNCARHFRLRRWMEVGLLFTLAAIFGLYLTQTAALWFSGRQWAYGEPLDVGLSRRIAALLGPRTIVIADVNGYSIEKKLTFLLLDPLVAPKNRPTVWYVVDPVMQRWSDFVERPERVFDDLDRHDYVYRWTRLRATISAARAVRRWDRILYIVQDRTKDTIVPNPGNLELVRRTCPGSHEEVVEGRRGFFDDYALVVCERAIDVSN
jgi:4-amino-4-deoxy-L-arabinose transferase-like glycosyltransferase